MGSNTLDKHPLGAQAGLYEKSFRKYNKKVNEKHEGSVFSSLNLTNVMIS